MYLFRRRGNCLQTGHREWSARPSGSGDGWVAEQGRHSLSKDGVVAVAGGGSVCGWLLARARACMWRAPYEIQGTL